MKKVQIGIHKKRNILSKIATRQSGETPNSLGLAGSIAISRSQDGDYDDDHHHELGNDDEEPHRKDISWNPMVGPRCVLVLNHLRTIIRIVVILVLVLVLALVLVLNNLTIIIGIVITVIMIIPNK